MISGIANSPIPDRENELITADAMEKAIPSFMKIPGLHVNHTERLAGFVTECRVLKSGDPVLSDKTDYYDPDARIGDTYFKAVISEGDTDDIWESIQKGHLNRISIYGVRTEASSECKLRPHERVSPCITKAIRLWSFSLVGDNAINGATYIKIAKAFAPELCSEFETNTIELIKAAFPGVNMAPKTDQQDQNLSGSSGDNILPGADVVMKSELTPVIQDITLLKSDVTDVKTGINAILDSIKKSSQDITPPVTEQGGVTGEYITKAALESTIDVIIKAKVELIVADVMKGVDQKISELNAKIDKFGDETIQKGGNAVFFNLDGTPGDGMENPYLSNLDALEG